LGVDCGKKVIQPFIVELCVFRQMTQDEFDLKSVGIEMLEVPGRQVRELGEV
jgi:hypothetical protein